VTQCGIIIIMSIKSKNRKPTFLVTGGNGYIGSHMCRFLAEKGHEIYWIDDFSTSPPHQVHKYGHFHEMDLGDKTEVKKHLRIIKPDVIIHFAAAALVSEGESDPFLYYQKNLVNTLNLLEGFTEIGGEKFIFSSTCATFGVPAKNQKIHENLEQKPINTYGQTKYLVEQVMRNLVRLNQVNVVALRYFNVAGCSVDSELGENHKPETHLIPNLVRAHLEGKAKTFELFGDDHETPDGTCIRDYIHVLDLVRAHYLAFEYFKKEKGFHAFNLGSGKGHSVKDVITAFEEVTDSKLKVKKCPARAGDPPKLVADCTLAKKELKFEPEYGLEDCIRDTLNYIQQQQTRDVA
jgi:UDP-glucose 4-epimerase